MSSNYNAKGAAALDDTDTSATSFAAFSKVDELVSKPVLGSDGAASWQKFRKDHASSKKIHPSSSSVAPKAPLKKLDRLAFTSWEEEQQHENKMRKDAGHVQAGAGYTNFKKKNAAEEAKERKRKAQIEKRIRPDDKDYFVPSPTFQGWKFDYIFTTRVDRGGTGYYWDGSDGVKSLQQEGGGPKDASSVQPNEGDGDDNGNQDKTSSKEEASAIKSSSADKPKKKKRKKDKSAAAPVFVSDPNNPLEQAQVIWQQRNKQALTAAATAPSDLPVGWEAARDPSSGKTYYFQRSTGQRSWEKPFLMPPSTTHTMNANEQADADDLPDGWESSVDATSGKTYYYHTNGETKWEKPSTS